MLTNRRFHESPGKPSVKMYEELYLLVIKLSILSTIDMNFFFIQELQASPSGRGRGPDGRSKSGVFLRKLLLRNILVCYMCIYRFFVLHILLRVQLCGFYRNVV